MIETEDFLTFQVRTLNGEAVRNKGMALFPTRLSALPVCQRLVVENLALRQQLSAPAP
jgi:hypothetical protein